MDPAALKARATAAFKSFSPSQLAVMGLLGAAVLIGPADRGSGDASMLESAGALIRLGESGAAEQLARRWGDWLSQPELLESRGEAAREALEGARGAAASSAERLAQLLDRRITG